MYHITAFQSFSIQGKRSEKSILAQKLTLSHTHLEQHFIIIFCIIIILSTTVHEYIHQFTQFELHLIQTPVPSSCLCEGS